MVYMLVVLAFIVGFFIGALCFSFGLLKIFPNHRIQDELTRTKRELAAARRVLEEFFKTSNQLFGQLDKSYRDYAAFMREASAKISAGDGSNFMPQDEYEVESSLKKMLGNKHLEDFNAESEKVTSEKLSDEAASLAAEPEKQAEPEPVVAEEKQPEQGVLQDAKETISVSESKPEQEKF